MSVSSMINRSGDNTTLFFWVVRVRLVMVPLPDPNRPTKVHTKTAIITVDRTNRKRGEPFLLLALMELELLADADADADAHVAVLLMVQQDGRLHAL